MKHRDLILIIDMQNVYTRGQKWECLRTGERADRILRILSDPRMRDTDFPVTAIFTRYLAPKEPKGVWQQYNAVNRQVNEDAFANAMMPQFQEALTCYPLYTKSVYSSLAIPEVLDAARAAKRVVVTGVVAECCVLSTVMALIDEGIYTIWLSDAIAGLDAPKEEATERILSGLDPLHLTRMTTEEYLTEK